MQPSQGRVIQCNRQSHQFGERRLSHDPKCLADRQSSQPSRRWLHAAQSGTSRTRRKGSTEHWHDARFPIADIQALIVFASPSRAVSCWPGPPSFLQRTPSPPPAGTSGARTPSCTRTTTPPTRTISRPTTRPPRTCATRRGWTACGSRRPPSMSIAAASCARAETSPAR